MTTVSLSVNGSPITADIESRTHLADFLRGHLHLTGTHLGCEQGVCGACTVLIDGKPQRSCLTFVVDSGGADVRSIESFDHDPIMSELRAAFSAFHALQCGFCTPGMLVSARDIIVRLGEVSERRIREELSGNLCRCTGYVGIVDAIHGVSKGKTPGKAEVAAVAAELVAHAPMEETPQTAPAAARPAIDNRGTGSSVEERIVIKASPDKVWALLSDLRLVASCIPGTEITDIDGEKVKGRVRIALGPIKPAFDGEANVVMNDAMRQGRMTGRGKDKGTGSSAEGEARWSVIGDDLSNSIVIVNLTWRLTGMLSQFNRSGLVQDIVRRLATTFSANLDAALNGQEPVQRSAHSLSVIGLLWAVIRSRLFPRS